MFAAIGSIESGFKKCLNCSPERVMCIGGTVCTRKGVPNISEGCPDIRTPRTPTPGHLCLLGQTPPRHTPLRTSVRTVMS